MLSIAKADVVSLLTGEYFDQNHRLPNLRAQQSTSRQPTPKVKPRRNYTSAPATVHDADSDDSDESSASNSDDDDDDSDNASSNSESPEVSTASRSMRGSTLRKRAVVQRSPDLPYVNPESPDSADEVKKIAPVPVAAPVVRPPPPPTRIVSVLCPNFGLRSLLLLFRRHQRISSPLRIFSNLLG